MADVLVDTDIFIDHFRGHYRFEPGADLVFYSILTRAELFAGRSADPQPIGVLLGVFAELSIDRAIAEWGGSLRRSLAISLAGPRLGSGTEQSPAQEYLSPRPHSVGD